MQTGVIESVGRVWKMELHKLCVYFFIANILVIVTFTLPKMNHERCLEKDNVFTQFVIESLEKCVQECMLRIQCLSLNYRRQYKLCELLAVADGTFVTNNGRTGPCVHILRSDITETKYLTDCACENKETCNSESESCVVKECPNIEFPNGKIYGNMRYTGARAVIKCINELYAEVNDRTSIECLADGTWDYEPNCVVVTYAGCYKDDKSRILMGENLFRDGGMTIEKCIGHCSEYKFASTQHSDECFCGDALNENLTVPDAECTHKCAGNMSQTCGGSWRGSVFRLK